MPDIKISAATDIATPVASDMLPLARVSDTSAYHVTIGEIALFAAPVAATALPAMDGTAAAGVATALSRGDHVHPSDTSRLATTGGTLTGALNLAADPTAALQAATKQYVDTHTSPGGATISDTPPASPANGALWWDSSDTGGQLYVRYVDADSSQWVIANSGGGGGGTAGVSSFNTRTGAVTLSSGDVTTALTYTPYDAANPSGYQTAAQVSTALAPYAPLASPALTGNPTAPTPPQGDADTSIATTAFVQATVAPALNNVGRNLLHNAAFNVAQRGNPGWTVSGYTGDRWTLGLSLDTATIQLSAMNDTQRAQIGDESAAWCLTDVFTGNAGASASHFMEQRIEDLRRLAGNTVTISVYAVGSATQKLGVSLLQYFGTGGSPSAVVVVNGQAVQLSNTWARYSVTFAVPSLSGKTIGTSGDAYTGLRLWYSSGATNNVQSGSIGVQSGTVQIWGVQLEIGTQATPLEKIDPADDLRRCQRFYQVGYANSYSYGTTSTNYQMTFPLRVSMRASPTVALQSPATTNIPTLSGFANGTDSVIVGGAVTANGPTGFNTNFTASADL